MTFDEAKSLEVGQIVYCNTFTNADGTACRWKINGKVKTWKRDETRIQIPVKRGMYQYGYIDETNFGCFSLTEDEANDMRKVLS